MSLALRISSRLAHNEPDVIAGREIQAKVPEYHRRAIGNADQLNAGKIRYAKDVPLIDQGICSLVDAKYDYSVGILHPMASHELC